MVATERSAGSRRFAFATRSTGSRNPFADAGAMPRFTTGCARSGCDTVIVAVCLRAKGGITTVKSPTDTTPPRSPTTTLFEAVLEEDPPRRLRPSTWLDDPPVAPAEEPDGAWGAVGMVEQPASATKRTM